MMGVNLDQFKLTLELQAEAAKAAVYKNVAGQSTLSCHISFGGSGTVVFEGTFNGASWFALPLLNMADDSYDTSCTAPGNFIGSIEGMRQVRFRVSSQLGSVGSVDGQTTDSPYVQATRTTAL